LFWQVSTAGALSSQTASGPATDSGGSTDVAGTSDSVSPAAASAATDLFSVHDFDVNINMDIAPGLYVTPRYWTFC